MYDGLIQLFEEGVAKGYPGLASSRWRHFIEHHVIERSQLYTVLTTLRDKKAKNRGNRSAKGCSEERVAKNDNGVRDLLSRYQPTNGAAGIPFWIREKFDSLRPLNRADFQNYFVFDDLTYQGLQERCKKDKKKGNTGRFIAEATCRHLKVNFVKPTKRTAPPASHPDRFGYVLVFLKPDE
jgi:hypothetical protein